MYPENRQVQKLKKTKKVGRRVNHKQRITLPALDSTVHKTHQTLYVRFTFHSGIIHRGFCKLVLGGFSDFHKNLNCRLHPEKCLPENMFWAHLAISNTEAFVLPFSLNVAFQYIWNYIKVHCHHHIVIKHDVVTISSYDQKHSKGHKICHAYHIFPEKDNIYHFLMGQIHNFVIFT